MLVAVIFAEMGLEKRLDRTNVSGDINGELENGFHMFACRLPKTAEAVAMSDLGMVFIGEPELVNITLTYIPEEADCVQYVLHACRGKDGKFHALNVQPKVVKALMFDCLPLHG